MVSLRISPIRQRLTLKQFCAVKGIPYRDTGLPVRLETFTSYGLAFQERMVPELEDKNGCQHRSGRDGFIVRLDDGETFIRGRWFWHWASRISATFPRYWLIFRRLCSHSAQHSMMSSNFVVKGSS